MAEEAEPAAEEPAAECDVAVADEAGALAEVATAVDDAALVPVADEAAVADADELYGGAPYATPVSAVLALITLGCVVKLLTSLAPAVGCTVSLVPALLGVVLAT